MRAASQEDSEGPFEVHEVEAANVAIARARVSWRPPPALRVSEWAEQKIRLPEEYAAEPGAWSNDRFPYQREMLDAVHEPGVEAIVFMTSAQVGKSSVIDNLAGYFIDQDPSPILWILPTLELAEAYSVDRLAPLFRASPALNAKVSEARTRDGGNTKLHKTFPGGRLTLCGANSPASLSSRPIRVLFGDEVDRFPASAGTEGDPIALGEKRTTRFWNAIRIYASTPGIRGVSRIERLYENSDQRKYFVPCPECSHAQVFKWEGVRYKNDDPETAIYRCEKCAAEWDDEARLGAVANAKKNGGGWRATRPEQKKIVGFHIWEAYAAVRLSKIVAEWLEARKSRETHKAFVNTVLGETWNEPGTAPDHEVLRMRAEPYPMLHVPKGAFLVTAGVDVQDDRLAVAIRAFGRGEESWLMWWGELDGDPVEDHVWKSLDDLLLRKFPRIDAPGYLALTYAAVDTGGHRTHSVYYQVAKRRQYMAIKGTSARNKPVLAGRPTPQDINYKGKKIEKGVMLWPIGKDTAVSEIYARLRIVAPGPQYLHFPAATEGRYFEQLTATKMVPRVVKGVPKIEWVLPSGSRDEALDCEVYAYVAALRAGVARLDWDRLERAIARRFGEELPEKQKDAPAPTIAASSPVPTAQAAPEDAREVVESPPLELPQPRKRFRRAVIRSSFMQNRFR